MLELSSMLVLLCLGMFVMVYLVIKVQQGIRSSGYTSSLQYGKTVQFLHDKHDLHALGIGQYLRRKYGEWSSFGISFNHLGVLSTTLLLIVPIISNIGIKLTLILFPIIGLLFVLLSAVLGQLLSPLPTAGGLYHVAYIHSNSVVASIIGTLKLIAHLCAMIFYAMGCTMFIMILLQPYTTIMQQPIIPYCVCIAIIFLQLIINSMKSSLMRFDQWLGLFLQIIAIVFVIGAAAFLVFFDSYPALSIFLNELPTIDSGNAMQQTVPMQIGMAIALLCKWFAGSEGASEASEETYEPKVRTPWSILQSSIYSYIIGFVLLLVLSVIVLNASIIGSYNGHMNWLNFLISEIGSFGNILIVIAILTCFQSGGTSLLIASRGLFALVRDQQLPFSQKLALISYTRQIPHRCLLAVAILAGIGVIMATLFSNLMQVVIIMIACYITVYVLILYIVKPKQVKGIWTIGSWFNRLRIALILPLLIVLAISGSFISISIILTVIGLCLLVALYSYLRNGIQNYESISGAQRNFELESKLPIQ